jgi:hypothetical protein
MPCLLYATMSFRRLYRKDFLIRKLEWFVIGPVRLWQWFLSPLGVGLIPPIQPLLITATKG